MYNKIRVLHIIGSLRIGGAENIALNFARYLPTDKYQIDYLVFENEVGEYEDIAISLGAKIYRLLPPSAGYIKYYISLIKLLKKNQYDIVHVHTLLNSGLNLLGAKKVGIKKRICHSHSTNSGKKETFIYKCYRKLMSRIIRYCATDFIACGKEAGVFLYGNKVFNKKGVIINNCIDIEKFKYCNKMRLQKRQELKIEEDTLLIGHVGRFAEVKNHTFLIDIFYELSKLNSNAKLLLVGDGFLHGEIKRKVEHLELAEKVIFTGTRSDVADLIQAIDIFILPSLYEGFPVVMIEVQASGTKCIVSDSVTQQVKITNLVSFMSLHQSPKKWATMINTMNSRKDDTVPDILLQKGYGISAFINRVEQLYTKNS